MNFLLKSHTFAFTHTNIDNRYSTNTYLSAKCWGRQNRQKRKKNLNAQLIISFVTSCVYIISFSLDNTPHTNAFICLHRNLPVWKGQQIRGRSSVCTAIFVSIFRVHGQISVCSSAQPKGNPCTSIHENFSVCTPCVHTMVNIIQ